MLLRMRITVTLSPKSHVWLSFIELVYYPYVDELIMTNSVALLSMELANQSKESEIARQHGRRVFFKISIVYRHTTQVFSKSLMRKG